MATNYPNGLNVYGAPVSLGESAPPTGVLFVDARPTSVGGAGSDGADGISNSPLVTMAEAFDRAASGNRIYVKGKITEEVLSPLGVQGIQIYPWVYGAPRHADGDNDYNAFHWTVPAAGGTTGGALLTFREAGCELHGCLMVPKSDGTALRLRRAEDATYPDGGKAKVIGNKFIGASIATQIGVEDHGGSAMNEILFNKFYTLQNGIKHTTGAGIDAPIRWYIYKNWFTDETNHLVLPGNNCVVEGNVFDEATVNVDTRAGTSGENFVIDNYFSNDTGDISQGNGYFGHASDVWRNFAQTGASWTVGVPS